MRDGVLGLILYDTYKFNRAVGERARIPMSASTALLAFMFGHPSLLLYSAI